MKVRTLLMASLAALLVASVGLVSAQDMNFGLSDDDSAYLSTAMENTATALTSSFQQDFTVDASVTGIPNSDDVTLHVDGTGPVVASDNADVPVNFAATVNIKANDGTNDTDTSVEVRLVDGIVYVQDPTSEKWVGVKVADVMAQAESNPMMPNPTTFDPSQLGLDEADMAALMELPKAEGFLSQVRDGETFTFTADIGALLKSAEWAKVSANLAPKLQKNPDTAQFAMVLAALPMLLSEGTIKVVQVVDPSINAVTEVKLLIDGKVNAGMMSGDSSAAPVAVSFAFDIKVSNIGGDFTVEAPADATIQEMPSK